MNSIGQRNDSDWNVLFEENQRLENEIMDLRFDNDQLTEQNEQLKAALIEATNKEQEVRKQLVEERERMLAEANEKAKRRLAFSESKAQKRVSECLYLSESN